jgi:phosphoglycolate phosphatase-like HAD superfamily hydrolase
MGALAMGRLNAAQLDAVTLDVFGTLATLVDPIPRLQDLLPEHARGDIERAFQAEGAYYRANVARGHDAETLAQLRQACVSVFNDTLGSTLTVDSYVDALRFELLPGVNESLSRLRALGLTLAVVANWDFGLHEHLETLDIDHVFATVVHAAAKPDPAGIVHALHTLGVRPDRALHIGDEAADEHAARAAGVHFLPAPLSEAVASIA